MHIVALNHAYPPGQAATGQLLAELAEGLAERGHRVTIITADHAGERPVDHAGVAGSPATALAGHAGPSREGVEVRRVRTTHLGKGRLWQRALDYASFYAGAMVELGRLELGGARPDVFMPLTTPPLIGVGAQLAAALRGAPVVQVVQDLYPDLAVELGAVSRRGAVHRAWRLATRLSLQRARRVVVLSEGMRRRVRAYGVADEAIDTIPNWALSEVESAPASGVEARLAYGLGERMVVMYSGNLGAGHAFETILAAAEALAHRGDIVFAFVGDGVRRGEVERFIAARGLSNVRLFPLAARARLAESLAAADLHVITLRDEVAGMLVPSKLYGILGAARPALFIGPIGSDVAQLVAEAGAGSVVPNGDVAGAVRAITALADDPERGRAAGAAGRRFLLDRLSREAAVTRYEATLARAIEAGGAGGAGGAAEGMDMRRRSGR